MSTQPGNDPNRKSVPPDPGGRSRYLLRGIVIACAIAALLAVVLLLALREQAPPPTPQQQPGGSASLALPTLRAVAATG